MQGKSNYLKVNEIFVSNGEYITRRQIDENNIPSWFLTDFVRKKNLVKIDKGFYADRNWMQDDYFVFQYKYPRYVFSYESALFLLELTDNLPQMIEVTGPRNYRPFSPKNHEAITHTDSKDETYHLGITEIKTNLGNVVRTYDAEKTLCDFIKRSNSVDSETYTKAIRNYAKNNVRNPRKLMEYAKIMGIYRKVSDIMMVVLNED